jgi:Recombinase zinc beta ribbon domain
VTLQAERFHLPVRQWGGPAHGQLAWKVPTYRALVRLLRNPAYAGASVYGECVYDGTRRSAQTGKARPRFLPPAEWEVCLQGHHEGYIAWEEYLANRQRWHDNWFRETTPGAPRAGAALLQGLVWCGRCGAKMGVHSHAAREKRHPSSMCHQAYTEGGAHTCQSMTSKPVDDLVVSLFFDALAPVQIEIALHAVEQLQHERHALQHQWERQLEQARYAVHWAQRQYDAVDPQYRRVAAELEQRWNATLEALHTLEHAYADAQRHARCSVNPAEIQAMVQLAQDLPAVWAAPTTTDQERKQLLRSAIAEVQLDGVTSLGTIDIRVTWRSGVVTQRRIARRKVGVWAPRTAERVIERLHAFAPTPTVGESVERLNLEGLRSAHGRVLRAHHVLYLARRYGLPVTTCATRLQRADEPPQPLAGKTVPTRIRQGTRGHQDREPSGDLTPAPLQQRENSPCVDR